MGARIWLGRAEGSGDPWFAALRRVGRDPRPLPLIRRRPLPLGPADREALLHPESFAWAFFASGTAVRRLWEARAAGNAARDSAPAPWPARCPCAAVGPATAAALRAHGVEPALTGSGSGADLARAFLALEPPVRPLPPAPLLVLAARGGRPELRALLAAANYRPRVVELYRTEPLLGPVPPPEEPILLYSPSGARALAARVADPARHPVWAIGPTTAAAARELGFAVVQTLTHPTPEALLERIP